MSTADTSFSTDWSTPVDCTAKVAIVGMGYVGTVTSAALAARGWLVHGVEKDSDKRRRLGAGMSPVREPGMDRAIAAARAQRRLRCTDSVRQAVMDARAVMICVGTPGDGRGAVRLDAIDAVTDELGEAIARMAEPPLVMVRSTTPPGTFDGRIAPRLRRANARVVICHHPEFLREGSGLADWLNPPLIVHGADEADRPAVAAMIERLYAGIDAPRIGLRPAESELMKYASNTFHALKIAFANEIGAVASTCGADADAVMGAFRRDERLNLGPAYLKPGFAFGGSCLPKDTRALAAAAGSSGLHLPLVRSVLRSNRAHLKRCTQAVLDCCDERPTLLIGLSFKAGTDDLRESPMLDLAEQLIAAGVPLRIHDPDLDPKALLGANQAHLHRRLPHATMLMSDDLTQALSHAQVVVVAKRIEGVSDAVLHGKTVVDLTKGGVGGRVRKKAGTRRGKAA